MKRLLRLLLAVGLLGDLAIGGAAGTVNVNAAYVAKYIWRGYDLNGTQPALQPGATFSLGETGLSAGIWGSYNLGALSKQELTEVDYTLTYANSFGADWDYSFYYSLYNFPPVTGPAGKSGEFFFILTANKLLFAPTLLWAYDHDQGKGSYVSLTGKQSFSIGSMPLNSGLTVGYDGGQYGVTPGISDGTLALSSNIAINDTTLTPSLNYTLVNKVSRPAGENTFWFGLTWAGSQ